jgi:hypothetical protein
MFANSTDKTREYFPKRTSSVRELVAEELDAVCGGDGPPGCIPGVNCQGDPKGPKDLGEDDGW